MHLKLRHLQVFHAVMEEGSISKAADRMGLTQPAVSVALTNLEELLGYTLFNRSKGYFSPKPEARLLHIDAELSILAFEQFASRGKQIGSGNVGLVRIGSIGATALNLMPDVSSEYSQSHEQVEIQLQVRSSSQISHLVGNGQMDIGVVEAPVAAPAIESTVIRMPCVCIVHKDDPLASQEVITPELLSGRKLLSVFEGHSVDRQLSSAFSLVGIHYQPEIYCYFFSIMRRLISKGTGVAIVDAINGCVEANDNVVWKHFEPKIYYALALVSKVGADLQLSTREFLHFTHQKLMETVEQVD